MRSPRPAPARRPLGRLPSHGLSLRGAGGRPGRRCPDSVCDCGRRPAQDRLEGAEPLVDRESGSTMVVPELKRYGTNHEPVEDAGDQGQRSERRRGRHGRRHRHEEAEQAVPCKWTLPSLVRSGQHANASSRNFAGDRKALGTAPARLGARAHTEFPSRRSREPRRQEKQRMELSTSIASNVSTHRTGHEVEGPGRIPSAASRHRASRGRSSIRATSASSTGAASRSIRSARSPSRRRRISPSCRGSCRGPTTRR